MHMLLLLLLLAGARAGNGPPPPCRIDLHLPFIRRCPARRPHDRCVIAGHGRSRRQGASLDMMMMIITIIITGSALLLLAHPLRGGCCSCALGKKTHDTPAALPGNASGWVGCRGARSNIIIATGIDHANAAKECV